MQTSIGSASAPKRKKVLSNGSVMGKALKKQSHFALWNAIFSSDWVSAERPGRAASMASTGVWAVIVLWFLFVFIHVCHCLMIFGLDVTCPWPMVWLEAAINKYKIMMCKPNLFTYFNPRQAATMAHNFNMWTNSHIGSLEIHSLSGAHDKQDFMICIQDIFFLPTYANPCWIITLEDQWFYHCRNSSIWFPF